MTARTGFAAEIMRVLPRSVVSRHLQRPPTSNLMVTDAGFFPYATHHRGLREEGADELIVIVCTGGRGSLRLGAHERPVTRGDVVLIPPRIPHEYVADELDPWSIIWFHVDGRSVESLYLVSGLSPVRPVARARDPYRLVSLAEEIVTHLRRDETTASIIAASGAAWHMLSSLATQCAAPSISHDPVGEVSSLLQVRFNESLPVAQLAETVGMSVSHLATLFKRRTGQSVHDYQVSLRMSRARELLDLTQMTVGEVAHTVGYGDALYFARQFRNRQGLSPTEYRRRDIHWRLDGPPL